MKTSYVLFLLFLSFDSARSQSYELGHGTGGTIDTINKIDMRDWKQGKWIIKADYASLKKIQQGYQPGQAIETGMYKNNRKEGVWEEYYKNGKMRSKLTYVNGVLEGPAAFYNTDGKVMKEGSFKGNKWVQ